MKIPRALIVVTLVLGVIVIAIGAYTFGVSQRSDSQTNINTTTNNRGTNNTAVGNNNEANSTTNSKVKNVNVETDDNVNTGTTVTTNTNETASATNTTSEVAIDKSVVTVTDTGVSWLAEPKLLDDLNLFSDSESVAESDSYYKIADLADGGEIIYVNRETLGTEVDRFRKTVDGTYYLLANHSAEFYLDSPELLAVDVNIDATTTYAALDYPDELVVAGIALQQHWLPFTSNELFDEENNDPAYPFIGLDGTPYGTMYTDVETVATPEADGSIRSKSYVLKLADNSVVRYWSAKNFMADDGSLIANFNDEDTALADQTYFVGMVASGCGVLGGDQYIVDMTAEALDQVGMTKAGEALYAMRDAESSLLLNAYETYKIGRDYDGATEPVLSYDEFVAATPILLWQDALGDYLLLMDNEFAPLVECGKPVVYLYPETTTPVQVLVGADVRISDPVYDNGWQVTADPNGTLHLADGSTVASLYWEGKGYGKYPRVTQGRVVETKNIEQELRHDLATLGLNENETADFLEYWLPLMPKTPYVRLTWFDTAVMNELAPLAVQPRPDTVIRVFLDFAGQTSPHTTLSPQTLTATERIGFTLVEWGGLLLGR